MPDHPKIPKNKDLIKLKTFFHQERKKPIWIALEKEMRQNADVKPYNEKVGQWLKFLRPLLYHYYCTEKRKYNKMLTETGPPWFYEYSAYQIATLDRVKDAMYRDTLSKKTDCTARVITELGITLNFSKEMIMNAIKNSTEDPGIFFWNLYNSYYKVSPTKLLPHYDENAMLMMSALVFVDLEECKKEILKLTTKVSPPPPKPPKVSKKYFEPDVKYGAYLQKFYVPCYSNHPDRIPKSKPAPLPLKNKVKLKSKESYMQLALDESFLERRRERNRQEKIKERVCHYKFWEPPKTLRNLNKAMAAYINKMKMFKLKPRRTHVNVKPQYDNIQYYVKGVAYANDKPVYNLECIILVPTPYIPINGGDVRMESENVLNILGFYRYPRDDLMSCKSNCNCIENWFNTAKDYMERTMCDCHHNYDYDQEGVKLKKKYFQPPKNGAPFWIDEPLVYQFDEWQEFVRNELQTAMDSNLGVVSSSQTTIIATKLKEKELLSAFLANLSHTPLMIPHLPKANMLRNLQEFVRKHVKGDRTKNGHNKLLLKSKRKWLNLEHIDFKVLPYLIPFSLEQLERIKFCHRPQIQRLAKVIIGDFEKRTRKSWLEHSRMFWTTMMNDVYPNEKFLETFFTYMPARLIDTHVLNPYCPSNIRKDIAKTCSLEKVISLR